MFDFLKRLFGLPVKENELEKWWNQYSLSDHEKELILKKSNMDIYSDAATNDIEKAVEELRIELKDIDSIKKISYADRFGQLVITIWLKKNSKISTNSLPRHKNGWAVYPIFD